MLSWKHIISGFFVLSLLNGNVFAAARLEPLTVGYSNFTGTYAPLWIAVEEHIGAKYGLDLKAIYAGRIRPQQLLATGEVPVVLATATGAITSHILGVKDQVLVATITNKVGTALFAKSEIRTVEDLKGKIVATGRPGAFLDAMVRYVLRSKFGLVPDRDVKLLPSGEPSLSLQALERGVVDAAAMSSPYMFIARKAGLRELANFDKLGVEYPYTSVTVLRQTVAKNPDLVERFLKCIVEGIYLFKTNKSKTLAVFKRYMKGADDEILEETYQSTRGTLEDAPHPSVQVVKGALDMLSLQYPQAKQTDASLIVEPAFMKRIEESGFIRALYSK
ncbi:MAG TPA: ABC transporter substrate-binding protein [Candidatus Binatia bacterium]|jgi:ABC-type nitrate/sulfonate/bicarbonate transport system substrate-binding protein|nr:ABC transporter substrate-binding protein [Candidatus Binatia bacterium]